MKKLLACLLSLLSVTSFAQFPGSNRILSGIDLGTAFQKGTVAPSLTYYELLTVGRQKVFSIGWTFSAGYVNGHNVAFTTAPARLTREKTGIEALSAPLIYRNMDTVTLERTTQTLLNVGLRAQVKLGPVELGGSADVLGFILGRTKLGHVISSTGGYYTKDHSNHDSLVYFRDGQQMQYTKAKGISARLLGDNDRGSLATEVYARVMINHRIGVKAGYKWLTTETRLKIANTADDNLRYRRRTEMPYIAITFPFFK